VARKKRTIKKGDLVTLSSRCLNMVYPSNWSHRRKRLVGLITKIGEHRVWRDYSYRPVKQYTISWISSGPHGRQRYDRYFYREDLKYVKKLKPKK